MATVRDILANKGSCVAAIGENHSVLEAAREMNARRVGSLVVLEGETVVGIFTERDILTRIVAVQRDPAKTSVGEVMTTPVAVCHPGTTVEECRGVMTNKRIRHLPVVEDNRLVGIVTSGDIMASEIAAQQTTIEYMHEYLYGSPR
jgi:CBS domain-containing protein